VTQRLSRREQVRQDTSEEILRIAREEMKRDGVAALSLGAIARRLGMKTPSLYTYFDSKNALYDELFRRGFVTFGRWMDERADQAGSLQQKMEGVIEAYMRFAQTNPDLYQLMFQRPVPDFEPSAASMAVSLAELAKARARFGQFFSGGKLDTNLSFEEARDIFIALQYGLTALHLANDPQLPVGEGRFGKLIPQAVQVLLAAWQK